MSSYRIFVLLAWQPDLGAYVNPVGVLGVPPRGEPHVSWVPFTYESSRNWNYRLIEPPTTDRIEDWLSVGSLIEAEPPIAKVPVEEAVEGLLDQLLVEAIPALRPEAQ